MKTRKHRIKKQNKTQYNTTYGEMEIKGIDTLYNHLITKYNYNPNCFMDLGSGKGAVCIHMAKQPAIEHVLGIELVDERHEEAVTLRDTLNEKDAKKVDLILSDIFKVSLKKYKPMNVFIWISSLCFPQEVVNNIFKKLKRELRPGTIVCSSKTITNNIGTVLETITLPQSWNASHQATIYKL